MTEAPSIGTTGGGPTVLRMILGARLRRLRETSGVSREDAGDAIRASESKISRIELGRVPFRVRDLSDLLTLYNVTDPEEMDAFIDLAREANAAGWWQCENDWLPKWFGTYLGMEQAAQLIRSYEPRYVPELLQTERYARAALRLTHPDDPDEILERRVALRLRRQDIMRRREPPTTWFLVEATALRCRIGGTDVWREQLDHLIDVCESAKVTLQVLPEQLGGFAMTSGPFSILRFAEAEVSDIVLVTQLTASALLDRRAEIDAYSAVMARLSVNATPYERTPRMLAVLGTEQRG
ncbi:helix-turn-helix domain-containing protein [Nocardia sp. NPDC057030]|uniref:helix-turn-helix domain-containing protein n=1 Tax=unclassified Nocardia TaxID=2637762 RepID=UPI0036383891